MFGFKKRGEESNEIRSNLSSGIPKLPDLPDFDKLPDLPELNTPIYPRPLPPLPNLNFDRKNVLSNANQNVSNINLNQNMQDKGLSLPSLPNKEKEAYQNELIQEKPRKQDQIFVKLDKFQSALANFESIKEKIKAIEADLMKMREIREREDLELKEWEQEVQSIRVRIQSIENSLFKRVGE